MRDRDPGTDGSDRIPDPQEQQGDRVYNSQPPDVGSMKVKGEVRPPGAGEPKD